MVKRNDVITILVGLVILAVGIATIYIYKVKIESVRASIEIQEINTLNKVIKFEKEISAKRKENVFKEEEMMKDLDTLLEEIIEIEEQKTIKIAFFGDLMFDRDVSKKLTSKEKFDEFFSDLKDLNLESFDFVGANLETPVVNELNECQYSEKEIRFCSKSTFLPWIKEFDFNIFALANNHSMDGGVGAHKNTLENLSNENFNYFGYVRHGAFLEENYVYSGDIRGTNFAWHSYDFTIYGDRYLENYCEDLKTHKDNGYINFVVTHWGNEYQYMTHSKTQEQEAKKLIDCGADLIIGTHPHVIQDYEYYNGKLILYSLGNFLFDQNWSENTQKGIGVFIEYKPNGETKFESIERNVSV